jgi:uncharacterized membrane protein YkvA (DUF1232 family)
VPKTNVISTWKQRAKLLKNDVLALYLAYKDPRTPWYAKVFMAAVLGYAISPIDLIPDFIPVLGYVDDLIIVPAGILLAIKMIPSGVMDECREKVCSNQISTRAKWITAGVIVLIWLAVVILAVRLVWHAFS